MTVAGLIRKGRSSGSAGGKPSIPRRRAGLRRHRGDEVLRVVTKSRHATCGRQHAQPLGTAMAGHECVQPHEENRVPAEDDDTREQHCS